VLPTGRLFGRISQKGPNKSGAAGQFCGRILADFERSAEKGPNFEKIVSLLLSSLFLGKRPRNIVIFPLTQTKIVFFFSPNSFKKGKLVGDQIFSSAAEFFFWIGRKVLQ
jgi:hypothetical protein